MVGGSRVLVERTISVDFDSSYPTGGESISTPWNKFKSVVFVNVEPRGNRVFEVDYTAKKVKLFTALGTEAANESDQSSITGVRMRLVGYE